MGLFAGSIFSAFPVSANNSAASCLASCSCKVQQPPLSPLLLFVELVPISRCSICFTSSRTPTDVLLYVAYRLLHRRRGLQPGNHSCRTSSMLRRQGFGIDTNLSFRIPLLDHFHQLPLSDPTRKCCLALGRMCFKKLGRLGEASRGFYCC